MSHPERNETPRIALEDLLRLKRAERPSPEFWDRFEQELRAKQLAAIVEKRPWWIGLRLPEFARYCARFQVPVGAAAALAVSFIVVRENLPSASSISDDAHTAAVVSANAAVAEAVAAVSPSAIYEVSSSADAADSLVSEGAGTQLLVASSPSLSMEGSAPVEPGGLMAMIPWAPQTRSVSDKSDPMVLGELSQVQFLALLNPGRYHDFQGSVEIQPVVMPRRGVAVAESAATPVAASSREVRRDRILSNLIVADASGERLRLAQTRDVVARSLDYDRLSDGVRRVGMGGDRLTLKF